MVKICVTTPLQQLSVAMIVLSGVSTALRFWARGIMQKWRYCHEDWLTLAAVLCGFIVSTLSIVVAEDAFKYGRWMDSQHIEFVLRCWYITFGFFSLGVALAKIAALAFYYTIFGRSNKFRMAQWMILGLTVLWLLFSVPATIFNCDPVLKKWEKQAPVYCNHVNGNAWRITSAALSAFLDLVVLVLPVPMLLNLSMPFTRRLLVLGAFLCGYTALVASLGRLISLAKGDPKATLIWTVIEVPVSVFSINLPAIFAFVKRGSRSGIRFLFTTKEEPIPYGRSRYDQSMKDSWQSRRNTRDAEFFAHFDRRPSSSYHRGSSKSSFFGPMTTRSYANNNNNEGDDFDMAIESHSKDIHVRQQFYISEERTSGPEKALKEAGW